MSTFTQLIEEFRESLEDRVLSRREKREIKPSAKQLTDHEKQVMLAKVCQMAMEKATDVQGQNLLQWFYEAVKILHRKESEPSPHAVFFSPGNECREAIIREINAANKLIHICVFTISDDRITDALLHAHRRNVPIRIITDDDKSLDLGSDIERLANKGIIVQMDNSPVHMHHKFAIFDQTKVLTGSYNWTRSAAEHNYENLVVMEDAAMVRSFEQEFDRLWKRF